MDLLVATRSRGKLSEIKAILAEVPGLRVLDLEEAGVPHDPAEDALEPHDTFEENALSKARYFRALSGLPTVADDSGLEVDALGGAPGVRSKRFAPDTDAEGEELDEANCRYLLRCLEGTPQSGRSARYVCVAVLVDGEEGWSAFRGEAQGEILPSGRGSGGFGYDPLFFDPELGKTFAEILREDKNRKSHRGKAFRALAQHLAPGA
ncbi:MAG: non-canonical purine NTP pyrophosphatase [Longimicrobiales bacterium]|nr:non-canonical purine NTP pyrophosphatase [Longimicrobiales bacterium]